MWVERAGVAFMALALACCREQLPLAPSVAGPRVLRFSESEATLISSELGGTTSGKPFAGPCQRPSSTPKISNNTERGQRRASPPIGIDTNQTLTKKTRIKERKPAARNISRKKTKIFSFQIARNWKLQISNSKSKSEKTTFFSSHPQKSRIKCINFYKKWDGLLHARLERLGMDFRHAGSTYSPIFKWIKITGRADEHLVIDQHCTRRELFADRQNMEFCLRDCPTFSQFKKSI